MAGMYRRTTTVPGSPRVDPCRRPAAGELLARHPLPGLLFYCDARRQTRLSPSVAASRWFIFGNARNNKGPPGMAGMSLTTLFYWCAAFRRFRHSDVPVRSSP